jgi:hypothetical protein
MVATKKIIVGGDHWSPVFIWLMSLNGRLLIAPTVVFFAKYRLPNKSNKENIKKKRAKPSI